MGKASIPMEHRRTQKFGEALVVLGGTARKNGVWHSTLFERDGDLGDHLRVEAAAEFYQSRKVKPIVIVSGGRGTLPTEAPPVADVLYEELVALGVRKEDLVREDTSYNTYEQLCRCMPLLLKFEKATLISNEYHLPRIRASIECAPKLSSLKTLLENSRLSLRSAEAVLIDTDSTKWKNNIEQWYQLSLVSRIIRDEKRGVAEIKSGSYSFV